MSRLVLVFLLLFGTLPKQGMAQGAQDTVWIQIAARQTLQAALDTAGDYSLSLGDVNGFVLDSGWHAIVLGPYARADAENRLRDLRSQRLIPGDSYITETAALGRAYWPREGDAAGTGFAAIPAPDADPAPESGALTVAPGLSDALTDTESRAEARRTESLLSTVERQDLQRALQWAGFYAGTIDGAFGPGTRNAMARWQAAQGRSATGVLTTRQRSALMTAYNALLDGLGLETVVHDEAGIEIALPLELIRFEGNAAPFVQYGPATALPARVLLISQSGGNDRMKSLFDVMQTLAIVPPDGPRGMVRDGFTITGRDARIVSETRVRRVGEQIKGFTLVWPVDDEARRQRLLAEMEQSLVFRDAVLDPGSGFDSLARRDLIAGPDLRKPLLSRSGFFVDSSGIVVTTAEAVKSCRRITLDDDYEAWLTGMDTETGIAVLKPAQKLAPSVVARFSPAPPRPQSEIAVAGYSFEGRLSAPTITYGSLDDTKGLQGEAELNRLTLDALPGDAGGPVLDENGHVFGMLLPAPDGARRLPEDVRFALTGQAIARALETSGLRTVFGEQPARLDPVKLAEIGEGLTVRVSCWE